MKIAIYSRKSKFTGKGESIENQIELCKEHVSHKFGDNCEVIVYEDEGFSAKDTKRPMFQKLINDIKTANFDALVCYRLDRISRNVSDFSSILDTLERHKINFISLREQFDTSTPMGRAMIHIASVFAQLERETIAERVKDNRIKLAYEGRWQGGRAPIGYKSTRVESIENGRAKSYCKLDQTDDADWVRFIFDKFIELGSLSAIELYALKKDVKSPTGKRLTKTTIKRTLENPTYATNETCVFDFLSSNGVSMTCNRNRFDGEHGLIGYGKTSESGLKSQVKMETSNWIVGVGEHRGIIDGRSWVRAQRILQKNGLKYPRWETSDFALLSGILRCGKCGTSMVVKGQGIDANGDKRFYYVCSKKSLSKGILCDVPNINGKAYDQEVVDMIITQIGEIKDKDIKEKCKAADKAKKADSKKIENKISENERRIKALIIKMADSSMSAHIEEVINDLIKSNESLKNQLMELSKAELESIETEINKEIAVGFFNDFLTGVIDKPLTEQRELLKKIVKYISWDGISTDIELYV